VPDAGPRRRPSLHGGRLIDRDDGGPVADRLGRGCRPSASQILIRIRRRPATFRVHCRAVQATRSGGCVGAGRMRAAGGAASGLSLLPLEARRRPGGEESGRAAGGRCLERRPWLPSRHRVGRPLGRVVRQMERALGERPGGSPLVKAHGNARSDQCASQGRRAKASLRRWGVTVNDRAGRVAIG
jgi:hypothetical protein